MPIYEFRCNDTGKLFEVSFKSIAEYDPEKVRSPYTESADVTRIIRKVAIKKGSAVSALLSGDESSLEDLEHADPATMGRLMREMAAETGEDAGEEFHDIVDRLEKGQSPEEIEASLPPVAED